MNTSLACVVTEGKVKFKKFSSIKGIFEIDDIYREATSKEVQAFSQNKSLYVADANNFAKLCDQSMRKAIYKIKRSDILKGINVNKFKREAKKSDIEVKIHKNKIVIPADKKELKILLKYLAAELWKISSYWEALHNKFKKDNMSQATYPKESIHKEKVLQYHILEQLAAKQGYRQTQL